MSKNDVKNNSGIIRVVKDKNNPYVMMNKTCLNDPRLSFKAKGILAYLLSKPDNWKVIVQDLINHSRDGRDSIYSGLNELKKYGYLEKYPVKEKGKIIYWESIVYETPKFDFEDNTAFEDNTTFEDNTAFEDNTTENTTYGKAVNGKKPLTEKPDTGFPDLEKPDLENPERNNNDFNNNDSSNINFSNNYNNNNNEKKNVVVDAKKKHKKIKYSKKEYAEIKAKIESVTGGHVMDMKLREFLKRPNARKEIEQAIKNYPAVLESILKTKDVTNPVGLFFHIASNHIMPPDPIKSTKRDSFCDFAQHEYSEEELEYLFEDIGN